MTNQTQKETFNALHDVVLVVRESAEKTTAGGIILTGSTTVNQYTSVGVVLAIGPGRVMEQTGVFVPTTVKVGDRVVFPQTSGYKIELPKVYPEHEDLLVMREIELMGKLS